MDRDRRERRRRARSPSTSSSSDEEVFTHIQCWIPASGIDLVVLAQYLKEFIDDTATIRPAPNPNNREKQGFLIGARNTLSVAGCRDIIEDSRSWEDEKSTRTYRREPYSFNDSDTWQSRRKKGASQGHINPRSKRKQTADTTEPTSRTSATTQTTRPGTNRHGRDPTPEPPPVPGHPPPDLLPKDGPRVPQKPDPLRDIRKLSIADSDTREQYRKTTTTSTGTPNTSANRGARIQQADKGLSRHSNKLEDDTKQATGFSTDRRGRHADDDDGLSTTSTLVNKKQDRQDRHGGR